MNLASYKEFMAGGERTVFSTFSFSRGLELNREQLVARAQVLRWLFEKELPSLCGLKCDTTTCDRDNSDGKNTRESE